MANQGYLRKCIASCTTCKNGCDLYEELIMNKYTRFTKNDPVYAKRGLHKYIASYEPRFVRERKQRLMQESNRPYKRYRIGT